MSGAFGNRWLRRIAGILAGFLVLASQPGGAASDLLKAAEAGRYSAAGIYDPEVTRYDNGLTLITKQRPGIRTVSIRVLVGVGMAHYECGQRHVPHFLEHMLYDAIPDLPDQDLEQRFFEIGATSNAVTRSTETIYKLDVFSGAVIEGLDLTADMLTNAQLTPGAFEKTRSIIRSEEGGAPGPVELASLVGGRLSSGFDEVLAVISKRHFGTCGRWDTGENVKYGSVFKTYKGQYVPANMVWAIVGDFDPVAIRSWAASRLKPLRRIAVSKIEEPEPSELTRRFFYGFADEPRVVLAALTGGITGPDYYAVLLIEHLLDTRLFKRLRLDAPVAYTPYASTYSEADWGVFWITVEAEDARQQYAVETIEQLIAELRNAPLDEEDFEVAQLSLLRQWAQGTETSADYADYYINSLPQFFRESHYVNDEARLAALTPQAVHRVAARLFAADNVVYIFDADRQAEINAN